MSDSSSFDPLFQSSSHLNYVGSFFSKLLKKLCGERIVDILYHIPFQKKVYTICSSLKDFSRLKSDEYGKYLIKVRVKPVQIVETAHKVILVCREEEQSLDLIFFNVKRVVLTKMFPLHQDIWISGELTEFKGALTMIQPKRVYGTKSEELVYPLTKGLPLSVFTRIVFESLQVFQKIPRNVDWIDSEMRSQFNWLIFFDFMQALHDPALTFNVSIKTRLAFDELLAHQLSILMARKKFNINIPQLCFKGDLKKRAFDLLPYILTNDQLFVLEELEQDLQKNTPMHRLLQGDVGSGKTIVAFLSMLGVIELGQQCVFLAPTEVLAQQHYKNLETLAKHLKINLGLFLGMHSKSQKNKNAEALRKGEIHVAIGTHALFQDGIEFQSLKYVVIDEQHRFGVEQRLALRDKGDHPHTLMMTATPIPRTIVMAQYGDLALSFLKNKPQNRKAIQTSVISTAKEKEVIEGIKRVLFKGNQVYWVCPLIEESENIDLANVSDRYLCLKAIFGDDVALLHGKMKSQEKDTIMKAFQENIYKILVTTTVIEVGIDVPNATIMIIENAQRFGLSQLHQLRGRVGRGADQSYCMLMYDQSLKKEAIQRLEIVRSCDDGFMLSEMDLKLRGWGDLLGTQQSGFKGFRFFDQELHQSFIPLALNYAKKLYMDKENGKIEPLILLEIFRKKEDYRGI